MSKGVVLMVLALTLRAHPAAADGTIYGCANPRTNKVRLITTSPPSCRATETPVSWNQVGPQGPAGAQGAPGPSGPQGPIGAGLVVKDSAGKLVGAAVAPSHVALEINGQDVVIQMNRTTGFVEASMFGNFFFANPDCTGDAFPDGQVFDVDNLLTYAVQVFRGTVYYPAEPTQFGTPHSELSQTDGNPSSCTGTPVSADLCCYPVNNGGPVLVLKHFDLTSLGLVPPFHVEGP